VARYDRAIPPGGIGKITIEIESSKVRGKFEKKAVVWSNDGERRSVALYLKGEVKPHISVEPGAYLSLWGTRDHRPKNRLEIINNHEKPLKITGIETSLKDRIRWHLKEIKPGYIYALEVEDVSRQSGQYTGRLFVRTDNPKNPVLTIIISGDIRDT
jgi:hypothetical protein